MIKKNVLDNFVKWNEDPSRSDINMSIVKSLAEC